MKISSVHSSAKAIEKDDDLIISMVQSISRNTNRLQKNLHDKVIIVVGETEIDFKADALMRMMWICEVEEDWKKLQELLKIYDGLGTDEFLDDVKELKKILRKAKSGKKG